MLAICLHAQAHICDRAVFGVQCVASASKLCSQLIESQLHSIGKTITGRDSEQWHNFKIVPNDVSHNIMTGAKLIGLSLLHSIKRHIYT